MTILYVNLLKTFGFYREFKKKKIVSNYVISFSLYHFKSYVSTPHNDPLVMGDRHTNFEDEMLSGQYIRKTK